MATFHSFVEIEAWQIARQLTFQIYAISKRPAFAEDFGLQKQIRDASVSIMSNIAEGIRKRRFQRVLAIFGYCERLGG
jgi:four helix bundle protein